MVAKQSISDKLHDSQQMVLGYLSKEKFKAYICCSQIIKT